jgi:hypothetical protein
MDEKALRKRAPMGEAQDGSSKLLGPDMLNIQCLVCPDGTVLFVREPEKLSDTFNTWKARLTDDRRQEYDEAKVCGGVVMVTMLRKDYMAIPVDAEFPWP